MEVNTEQKEKKVLLRRKNNASFAAIFAYPPYLLSLDLGHCGLCEHVKGFLSFIPFTENTKKESFSKKRYNKLLFEKHLNFFLNYIFKSNE